MWALPESRTTISGLILGFTTIAGLIPPPMAKGAALTTFPTALIMAPISTIFFTIPVPLPIRTRFVHLVVEAPTQRGSRRDTIWLGVPGLHAAFSAMATKADIGLTIRPTGCRIRNSLVIRRPA